MRIDAYHAVNQIYQTNKTNSKSIQKQKKSGSDSFEISDFGKTLQIAKQSVAEAPEVREDRIARIREQLANGAYDVSIEQVAQKMVDDIF